MNLIHIHRFIAFIGLLQCVFASFDVFNGGLFLRNGMIDGIDIETFKLEGGFFDMVLPFGAEMEGGVAGENSVRKRRWSTTGPYLYPDEGFKPCLEKVRDNLAITLRGRTEAGRLVYRITFDPCPNDYVLIRDLIWRADVSDIALKDITNATNTSVLTVLPDAPSITMGSPCRYARPVAQLHFVVDPGLAGFRLTPRTSTDVGNQMRLTVTGAQTHAWYNRSLKAVRYDPPEESYAAVDNAAITFTNSSICLEDDAEGALLVQCTAFQDKVIDTIAVFPGLYALCVDVGVGMTSFEVLEDPFVVKGPLRLVSPEVNGKEVTFVLRGAELSSSTRYISIMYIGYDKEALNRSICQKGEDLPGLVYHTKQSQTSDFVNTNEQLLHARRFFYELPEGAAAGLYAVCYMGTLYDDLNLKYHNSFTVTSEYIRDHELKNGNTKLNFSEITNASVIYFPQAVPGIEEMHFRNKRIVFGSSDEHRADAPFQVGKLHVVACSVIATLPVVVHEELVITDGLDEPHTSAELESIRREIHNRSKLHNTMNVSTLETYRKLSPFTYNILCGVIAVSSQGTATLRSALFFDSGCGGSRLLNLHAAHMEIHDSFVQNVFEDASLDGEHGIVNNGFLRFESARFGTVNFTVQPSDAVLASGLVAGECKVTPTPLINVLSKVWFNKGSHTDIANTNIFFKDLEISNLTTIEQTQYDASVLFDNADVTIANLVANASNFEADASRIVTWSSSLSSLDAEGRGSRIYFCGNSTIDDASFNANPIHEGYLSVAFAVDILTPKRMITFGERTNVFLVKGTIAYARRNQPQFEFLHSAAWDMSEVRVRIEDEGSHVLMFYFNYAATLFGGRDVEIEYFGDDVGALPELHFAKHTAISFRTNTDSDIRHFRDECVHTLTVPFFCNAEETTILVSGCIIFQRGGSWATSTSEGGLFTGNAFLVPPPPPHTKLTFRGAHTTQCGHNGVHAARCSLARNLNGITIEGTFHVDARYAILPDRVHVKPGATLEVRSSVSINNLDLEHNSTLSILETPDTQSDALSIQNFHFGGILSSTLRIDNCIDTIYVAKDVHITDNATYECTDSSVLMLPDTSGEYSRILSWGGSLDGEQCVVIENCVAAERNIDLGIVRKDQKLLMQFTFTEETGHWKGAVVGWFVFMITLIVVAGDFIIGSPSRKPFATLWSAPPIHLSLSWMEVRLFSANFMAAFAMLYEWFFLFCVAFHPGVPWPSKFARFQDFVGEVRLYKGIDGDAFRALFGTCALFTFAWAILWIPNTPFFQFLTKQKPMLSTLQAEKEEAEDLKLTGMRRVSRCMGVCTLAFHRFASILVNLLLVDFFLILSIPYDCKQNLETGKRVMRVLPDIECWGDKGHAKCIIVACLSMLLITSLAFHSANNTTTPFGHPPFRQDLDVRHKRGFEMCRVLLLHLQVVAINIFESEIIEFLLISAAIQLAYLLVSYISYPCAYFNVNRIRLCGQGFCLWATLSGCVVALHHGQHKIPCEDTENGIVMMLVGGLAFSTCSYIYWAKYPLEGGDADLVKSTAEKLELIHAVKGSIAQVCSRQFRGVYMDTVLSGSPSSRGVYDNYSSPSSQYALRASENQAASSNTQLVSELQLKLRREINTYRRLKEEYLVPYYQGRSMQGVSWKDVVDTFARETFQSMTTTTDTTLAADASCEKYEGWAKGQLLGRGSFGSVYMGILRCGSLVAVKVIDLRADVSPLSSEVRMVQKEVDFIKKLRHPNVIAYKACYFDRRSKSINIFMEYAVGGSLTSLVKKCSERLSEDVVKRYVAQILQGLEFLHSKGVIHRDIKGENVLLDANGRVKLADFGCARDHSAASQLCGTFAGSPYWMAPEVIKNNGYDDRADIWSVGCTTMEVLNGYVT